MHAQYDSRYIFEPCQSEFLKHIKILNHAYFRAATKIYWTIVQFILQKYSTLWKFSLNFCLYLRIDLGIFFTKFWSSDSSFNRNILKPLHLKFEISTHAQIENTCLHIIYKFPDMIWSWNLHRGYSLINEVGQWFFSTWSFDVF